MSTSCPVLQNIKISPQTESWTILVKFYGLRRWRTSASIINNRSGWMLRPQVANNIIWVLVPPLAAKRQGCSHCNGFFQSKIFVAMKKFLIWTKLIPNPKPIGTKCKQGWPNPSNLHGVLSTMTMQGARGRASKDRWGEWRWSNWWGEWRWSNGWGELMASYWGF